MPFHSTCYFKSIQLPIITILSAVTTSALLHKPLIAACRRPFSSPLPRTLTATPRLSQITKRGMTQQITEALSKLDTMISGADQNGGAVSSPDTVRSINKEIARLFDAAIASSFPSANVPAIVAMCNQPKFGDYQCNNAMALHGRMKGQPDAPKNPRAVAEAILAALPPSPLISETSLAGPGFINIKINVNWLEQHLTAMLANPAHLRSWTPADLIGKKVIVDFSSPNVAKEMHVGHLRSTIIGDTIARTLEFCGADVMRLNHIGDWGTQFGMLIQFITELRPEGLNAATDEDVADLQVLYKAAKKRFDDEAEFKTRSREAVTRLQSGDEECMTAWKRICDASRREFEKIYNRLNVKLTERGESFYNPRLKDTVDALLADGIAEMSDGAVCVFVEGVEVPLIVRKTDGGFGYASTDMAAIYQRIHEEKADWIIYVTDIGQSQHFNMVFAAAKKAGYMPKDKEIRIDHVTFGLVLGEDNKKFKSRSGDTVRLVELLDEAKERCTATITARRPDIGAEELEEASCAMGYGAVKYADLKGHRNTNYRFSYDEMLSLQGNTAVYLLYAHARIASIIRKAGKDPIAMAAAGAKIELKHEIEVALGLHIARFPEALDEMLNDLAPNRITDYLFELSGVFNQFYTECQVVGSPEEESRLLLAEAAAMTMRQCLDLLGITPLYRI
jgi:arginyl-tRNA synthetase